MFPAQRASGLGDATNIGTLDDCGLGPTRAEARRGHALPRQIHGRYASEAVFGEHARDACHVHVHAVLLRVEHRSNRPLLGPLDELLEVLARVQLDVLAGRVGGVPEAVLDARRLADEAAGGCGETQSSLAADLKLQLAGDDIDGLVFGFVGVWREELVGNECHLHRGEDAAGVLGADGDKNVITDFLTLARENEEIFNGVVHSVPSSVCLELVAYNRPASPC